MPTVQEVKAQLKFVPRGEGGEEHDTILVSPLMFADYERVTFAKERIILVDKPPEDAVVIKASEGKAPVRRQDVPDDKQVDGLTQAIIEDFYMENLIALGLLDPGVVNIKVQP